MNVRTALRRLYQDGCAKIRLPRDPDASEQTRRSQQQDDRHDREDQSERELREEHSAEGVHRSDEPRPGYRARQRPEPAHHDDDERVDEVVHVHPGIQAEDRSRDDPRKTCERGADGFGFAVEIKG